MGRAVLQLESWEQARDSQAQTGTALIRHRSPAFLALPSHSVQCGSAFDMSGRFNWQGRCKSLV